MPSSDSKAKTVPLDPYRNFPVRIKLDGRAVAGISKVSGLSRAAAPAAPRPAGGVTVSHPATIRLERGLSHDAVFVQWAGQRSESSKTPVQDFRKDIAIEGYNDAGERIFAYNVFRCRAAQFIAEPAADAIGNVLVIQLLELENDGWEQDPSVTEPTLPGFTLPEC